MFWMIQLATFTGFGENLPPTCLTRVLWQLRTSTTPWYSGHKRLSKAWHSMSNLGSLTNSRVSNYRFKLRNVFFEQTHQAQLNVTFFAASLERVTQCNDAESNKGPEPSSFRLQLEYLKQKPPETKSQISPKLECCLSAGPVGLASIIRRPGSACPANSTVGPKPSKNRI